MINTKGEIKLKFVLREATLDDYEKIKPIHKEVHDLHVLARPDRYKPTEHTLDMGYYKGLIMNDDAGVFVIDLYDEIIAFTFLRKNETPDRETIVKKEYVFIEDFGVTEKYKEKGLGKQLFTKAVEFTKDTGAKSLELGVWEFNDTAIQFYEAMGMKTQARKMEIRVHG
ncbi:GNAT family N-acetyltransferase [Rossellomorea aquimaris]|uniref:GNAT family N-acetyltransferase n=1 Tax=Rossellomorea aquimaris TaxID=189382 RepID=A0A5D4TP72_9BACI|nr:GNAT family N-acetyltransferase [Rossellomorea aquimaris]TYS86688.1 GNAT family N-acetyltransferase [Rossellomorea aquimaris]